MGPNDLALSMGVREKDYMSVLEPAIQKVLDAAKKYNVPCGIHTGNLDWLIEWDKRGMQLIMYSNDIVFLRNGDRCRHQEDQRSCQVGQFTSIFLQEAEMEN